MNWDHLQGVTCFVTDLANAQRLLTGKSLPVQPSLQSGGVTLWSMRLLLTCRGGYALVASRQ